MTFSTVSDGFHVSGVGSVAIDTLDLGAVRLVLEYLTLRLGSKGFRVESFLEMLRNIKTFVVESGTPE